MAATEGGGGTKRSDGSDNGGASGSGDSQVMVCIELATGNLGRNITLIAMTIDSPTSTGIYTCTCIVEPPIKKTLHINKIQYKLPRLKDRFFLQTTTSFSVLSTSDERTPLYIHIKD